VEVINCSKCGSTDFTAYDDYYVCDYCKSKHVPEVKIKETIIGIQSDVEILLQKCKDDPSNRRRYAGLILDIDPTNQEAYQYLR
jgi:hypothetical protein